MPDAIAAARAKVYDEVFAPVFFHKLAQAGISPRTEAEARSLLAFGEAAFNLDRREAARRESARGDAFAKAAAMISAEAGFAAGGAAADDVAIKSAADALLRDPGIAAAVAALSASA